MLPPPKRSFLPHESLAVRRRGERFAIVSAATVVGTIACALVVASLMRPQAPAIQSATLKAPGTIGIAEPVPPSVGTTSVADCQGQTSPYVAQPCRVNETSKSRVRITATEKSAESLVASPPVVANLAAKAEAQTPASIPTSTEPAHIASIEPTVDRSPLQVEEQNQAFVPSKRGNRRTHWHNRGSRSAADVYYRRHTAQF
jgi:hypothetical protein